MESMQRLEQLVGEWGIAARFGDGPWSDMAGRMTCEWLLGGQYLVMRSEAPDPVPDGFTIIAPDGEGGGYTQHYYDSRGVTRLYAMTFDGRVWTLGRETADFSPLPFKQRFHGELSGDGQNIAARWERTGDDGEWMVDFELAYTRMS